MDGHTLYLHLGVCTATLASFILLALTTFSAPLSDKLYFLRSSQGQGVRFGTWGWCLEDGSCMTPMRRGYTWGTQIEAPFTGFLVLYPIAMVLTFSFLACLIFVLSRPVPHASRALRLFAVASFLAAATALIFMVATFDTARKRFANAGFSAGFGPLLWVSLAATALLAVSAILSFKTRPPGDDVSALSEKDSCLTSPPYRRRLRPINCVPRP